MTKKGENTHRHTDTHNSASQLLRLIISIPRPVTSGPPAGLLSVFVLLMILLFGDTAGSSLLLLMPLHLPLLTLLTAGEKMSLAIIYCWQSNQELSWMFYFSPHGKMQEVSLTKILCEIHEVSYPHVCSICEIITCEIEFYIWSIRFLICLRYLEYKHKVFVDSFVAHGN